MRTIIVGGALANRHRNSGGAWVRLSYLRGFQRLGFKVIFVEQIDPAACVNERGEVASFRESANLAYFKQVTEQFGLKDSAVLIYADGKDMYGATAVELGKAAASADLLLNISGHLTATPLLDAVRRRAFLDLDPGFTQFWEAQGLSRGRLGGYDFYFTVGENIGAACCPIPSGGVRWRATRPPVVLEDWPVVRQDTPGAFTTVGTWRGPFGPVQHDGRAYQLKVHEFRKFLSLPLLVDHPFEITMDIDAADHSDRQRLREHGWQIREPGRTVPDPETFRRYVQTSGAEFSAAQGIYVATESGWFSDRTVRYLASGKPALVQDTGFSRNIPTGEGLLSFATLEDSVAGARELTGRYDAHCRAARRIAETHFDSDKVLGRLLDETGVSA